MLLTKIIIMYLTSLYNFWKKDETIREDSLPKKIVLDLNNQFNLVILS